MNMRINHLEHYLAQKRRLRIITFTSRNVNYCFLITNYPNQPTNQPTT